MSVLALGAIAPILGFAAAGLLVGCGYFAALRRSAQAIVAGALTAPLALAALRIAAVLLLLGAAVRFGALPLLAAFGGLMLARGLLMRRVRESA
jgi:hypothetical protein